MPEYQLLTIPYDREKAVEYANYWAYRRNPKYYSFDEIGGDCTNFVSQSIFAGSGVMNFTPVYGWYYLSLGDRAPAWSGVEYLYNFLVGNLGPGPFGREVPLSELNPGDVIQLQLNDSGVYTHTVLVTDILGEPLPENIRIAAHDRDSACRPLSTYNYRAVRGIAIDGVRYMERIAEE